MYEYFNVLFGVLFLALFALMIVLLMDNNRSIERSNLKIFDYEEQIMNKIQELTIDGNAKKDIMRRIFESVQNNEKETHFLSTKVDLLTEDFYKRIVKIEKEIKELKEKINNDNI